MIATLLDSPDAHFLATVLGDSAYTRTLAPRFAASIRARYPLNRRYRRATGSTYWINLGSEWTRRSLHEPRLHLAEDFAARARLARLLLTTTPASAPPTSSTAAAAVCCSTPARTP
eukprot:2174053-Rhodomonas_salina.3